MKRLAEERCIVGAPAAFDGLPEKCFLPTPASHLGNGPPALPSALGVRWTSGLVSELRWARMGSAGPASSTGTSQGKAVVNPQLYLSPGIGPSRPP